MTNHFDDAGRLIQVVCDICGAGWKATPHQLTSGQRLDRVAAASRFRSAHRCRRTIEPERQTA